VGAMGREIDAVLAAVVPAREPLVVADWGAMLGESAGLGRSGVVAAGRGTRECFVVVGVTTRTIAIVPVIPRRGLCAMIARARLVPRLECAELLPRRDVIVEHGRVERRTDRIALPVRFVRRDGSARLVELYDDPLGWLAAWW